MKLGEAVVTSDGRLGTVINAGNATTGYRRCLVQFGDAGPMEWHNVEKLRPVKPDL